MSPKNKGNYGRGKKDKSGPDMAPEDEFVSTAGRVGKALEPHVKTLVVATVAVVALCVSVIGYRWWSERKEADATVVFEQAVTLAEVVVNEPLPGDDKPDEAKPDEAKPDEAKPDEAKPDEAKPDEAPPPDADGDGIPDEFHSLAQRAEAVLARLDELRLQYGSTDVAKQARMLNARMLYDLGRYEDAASMLRGYLSTDPAPALRRIAIEQLGYTEEAMAMAAKDDAARKAGLGKALETFKQIQTDDTGEGRDRALYHEARLSIQLGDPKAALAALDKAKEVAPQSDLRYDINLRRVALESKE